MKPLPIQPELLEKYLKGICTAEEKKFVEDWYAELDKVSPSEEIPVFDKMQLFEKIKHQVEDSKQYEKRPGAKVFSLFSSKTAIGAIAAVLILVIGFRYFQRAHTSGSNPTVADIASRIILNNNTAAILQKKLPDGSSVWLKPGSNLLYEHETKDAERKVKFTGEAFFEVAKDAVHPFIIQADEMKIRVVGTSFNVIALPTSRTFKVSVVTGKVQVTARDRSGVANSVYLMPKQQASFNLGSQKIVQTLLTETQLKKQYWKPFTLNFTDDATMGMVAKELERAFQVKIEFSSAAIANCHLKIDFNNQQLPEIMDYLEKLLDVTCEMTDGETLKITGEGCAA